MNILITGIHGFVGSNLVSALKNQHTIYGLDIVSPQKDGVSKTFGWDELGSIPPIEIIIHLAGKAHDTKKQTEAKTYFDINTGLTQKIFDWFQASMAEKFIFFSSVKAAADSTEGKILTEAVVPCPKGPYGESKLAAENYILTKGRKGDEEKGRKGEEETGRRGEEEKGRKGEEETGRRGEEEKGRKGEEDSDRKVYILRPCMIHGPGNKGNLNLLYNLVQKGLPWPLGTFENKRSFTSIDNLTYLISQLIDKNIESGIYQLADDEALSTNELIKLIASSQNSKAKIWQIPVNPIKIIARIGDFLHLPLNSERLRKLTESYQVSNQKIKNALGVKHMPVSAVDGFKKTFAFFKN